ncbi:hypothetical protein A1QO_15615 [Vibrio genomosp. F10 str. ZF-129]|uniref:Uncharacterized protein n=1 Tax=Vibrio genomosp. F10 str. ZF-129 TaxID=1187848 RepID=A0A1E5BA11_9VIBR|nr:hypothetical protein [Vibrio genomosp. F10]OEE30758.1 hypothetical protein A1QO_15615 [Vibrio genomosp. F10 str. ZF-129]
MTEEHKSVGNRLYFMNDKNIRDGLTAQRVKSEHLITFLAKKGIYVAQDSSKLRLIDMVQTMRFDHADYLYISSLLENPDRRDNQSTTELPADFNVGKVNTALTAVTTKLQSKEVGIKVKASGKKVMVEASYVDTDFSKAPMRQRTPKTALIEIDVSGSKDTSIRFPANEMGKELRDLIVSEMNKQLTQSVKPIEIDFEHHPHELRTKFFTKLLSLDDYQIFDVINVNVRNARGDNEENDVASQLRHVALSGKNLLTSNIYQSLAQNKYNIYRMSWKVRKAVTIKVDPKDASKDVFSFDMSDCFTIEAKFDDKERSKGFNYKVKAVHRYNKSKGVLNVTTGQLNNHEVDELSKLLVKSATAAFVELTSDKGEE